MHSPKNITNKLIYTIVILFIFFIIELISGFLAKSLSLLSDAAHMFTDIIALLMSWIATHVSQKPADFKRTFGYYRFEILAAAFNTLLLFGIAFYIFYEALLRIFIPTEIHSLYMFFIGLIGLIINYIALMILDAKHSENLNLKSAYLELLSDFVSSLGVLIAATIIFFYDLRWIDSLIAVLIACWVLPRGWIIFKESIDILLESVPEHINIHEIFQEMRKIPGVINIHDLHVWAINKQKVNLTAHVIIHNDMSCISALKNLESMLHQQFKINHTTLQLEYEECANKTKH